MHFNAQNTKKLFFSAPEQARSILSPILRSTYFVIRPNPSKTHCFLPLVSVKAKKKKQVISVLFFASFLSVSFGCFGDSENVRVFGNQDFGLSQKLIVSFRLLRLANYSECAYCKIKSVLKLVIGYDLLF